MKIEKGIPHPRSRFPFQEMEVGDSFLIPQEVPRMTVCVAAHRFGKDKGLKFSVRMTPEGYRCWRIK